MPEFCTCGARLPEDARFCHKCGKPQRESDIAFQSEQEDAAVPVPADAIVDEPRVSFDPVQIAPERTRRSDPSIGFRNPVAVRIALLASVVGFLVFGIAGQISGVLSLFVMLLAGTFAVVLYRRRTGLRVSVRGGIHIGWITGLFSFATAMVLVALMAVALMDQNFARVFESQLGSRSNQEIAKQVLDTFRSPKGVLDILTSFFIACGVMPTLGGALGAWLGRRN